MPLLTNQSSRLLGGRGSGLAVPVPTYGTERLSNADFEAWVSATNANTWTENIAGTSTVNREGTDRHAGTYAARMDVDASDTAVYITQATTTTTGSYYLCSVWCKAGSGAPSMQVGFNGTSQAVALDTTWTQRFMVVRRAANSNALFGYLAGGGGASKSIYIDDASVKEIDLVSMLSLKDFGALTTPTVKCNVTIGRTGTRAGVVGWVDSASNPQNLVMASIDGTYARMSKRVGGTWSDLVSATAITYSAGALLEIRRGAANAFSLYYNGTIVDSAKTISDAGIISNTLYGYANTDAANTVSGLVVA